MYMTTPGPEGRGKATLVPRAGKKLITSIPNASAIRGMIVLNEILYVVANNNFIL